MSELKIEACNDDDNNNNEKKRVRDELEDSDLNSPDSKLARLDSLVSDGNSEVSGGSLPEAKQTQDDLFNFLDDADTDMAVQDLDSVIRSFEEEILVPEQRSPVVISDSGELMPELGFLMEASDDDLGLPPSFTTDEVQKIEAVDSKVSAPVGLDFDDMGLGFENEMPNYEAYNFGLDGDSDVNVSDVFTTLGGSLFESYEAGKNLVL